MKTKKYFLFLIVVIGILCASAFGEIELPLHTDEPVLLGQPNPALVGVEKLHVFIVPPDSEPNKDGLVVRELEAKVINKLKEAGIKIMPGIAGNVLNIDELRVYIDMLKFADSQQCVFRIQTSLSRAVRLATKSKPSFKADVWQIEPIMQVVSVQSMPARVTEAVLGQVEAFICVYLVANPQPSKSSEAKTSGTLSPKDEKEKTKPVAKPAEAKYEYVASKNSKVFHKAECSSAKRISPKNLVSYNSRGEATKAGKRACKRCKP